MKTKNESMQAFISRCRQEYATNITNRSTKIYNPTINIINSRLEITMTELFELIGKQIKHSIDKHISKRSSMVSKYVI